MRQLYPISESLLSNSPPGCAPMVVEIRLQRWQEGYVALPLCLEWEVHHTHYHSWAGNAGAFDLQERSLSLCLCLSVAHY